MQVLAGMCGDSGLWLASQHEPASLQVLRSSCPMLGWSHAHHITLPTKVYNRVSLQHCKRRVKECRILPYLLVLLGWLRLGMSNLSLVHYVQMCKHFQVMSPSFAVQLQLIAQHATFALACNRAHSVTHAAWQVWF
jgi:hypothetical protein